MSALLLHAFHAARGASFSFFNEAEVVSGYGSSDAEYRALTRAAGVADLSFRGRICLIGKDRAKFLHGQVTNDVLRLKAGEGCYAALVNAKAKMESDVFVYNLAEELLLDFEPGLTARISDRLNRYVIADDVQVVDVAPHYGLLSVTGPAAAEVLRRAGFPAPEQPLAWQSTRREDGEIYSVNNPRYRVAAFDLFVPVSILEWAAGVLGGEAVWVGQDALETLRIENAVPRYGVDMTETTLPQEAGLESNAISFAKGCYIGQEIIARIRTYGQVAKALRLLKIDAAEVPSPGTAIYHEGKAVGTVSSATFSPKFNAPVALGYVRKECFGVGTRLALGPASIGAEIAAP